MIALSVVHLDPGWRRLIPRADAVCAAVLRRAECVLAPPPRGALSIALADDMLMRRLNLRYRRRAYAADVLSFPACEEGDLGEIVLSLGALVRDCHRYGVRRAERFAFFVAHGLLHLCGFDHHRAHEARRMGRLEKVLVGAHLRYV